MYRDKSKKVEDAAALGIDQPLTADGDRHHFRSGRVEASSHRSYVAYFPVPTMSRDFERVRTEHERGRITRFGRHGCILHLERSAAANQRDNLQTVTRFQNARRMLRPRDQVPVPLDRYLPRLELEPLQQGGHGCPCRQSRAARR